MSPAELKELVETGNYEGEFFILVCQDCTFLAEQYVKALCDNCSLTEHSENSILESSASSLSLVFNFDETDLHVVRTDVFSEITDYEDVSNTIVICNKVDKTVAKRAESYIIKMPKLQDWHVVEYAKMLYPELSEDTLNKLCYACKNNIYRTLNELDKYSYLPESERESAILAELSSNKTDLCNITDYEISDWIATKQVDGIKHYLDHRNCCQVDPIGLSTLMLTKVKSRLMLTSGKATAQELGISNGYAWHIKNDREWDNCDFAYQRKLVELLSGIDMKLKANFLDIPNERIMDYILINLPLGS